MLSCFELHCIDEARLSVHHRTAQPITPANRAITATNRQLDILNRAVIGRGILNTQAIWYILCVRQSVWKTNPHRHVQSAT